jgi:3-hydroxyisobutyrate dehydrogenase-like beta-hydroxyacid dehydrogenase
MSTVGADASQIVAGRLTEAGIGYLRAPVSGNPAVVRAGDLAILVSGELEDLERVRPVLEDIGRVVQHVGTGEASRIVKLALNIMIAGTAQLIAESVVLAESHGVDRRVLLDAMVSSAAGSPLVKYKRAALVERDYATTFSSTLMHKDLSLAVAAAEEHGVPLVLTSATRLMLQACMSTGLAELDFMALLINLQRQAGQTPDLTT